MKKQNLYKPHQIILLVLFCMIVNVSGRVIADFLNLPVWADSFGTFLAAYALGPVCGAIVGLSGNILHGLINPISFVYGLTSIFIAIIVGVMARRGWMETLLKTMSLSVLVTLVCVAISVVLNVTFYDGDIGNPWGNGIVELFTNWGIPHPICIALGQFYMDFLDKVFTLVSLYVFLRIYRSLLPKLPAFMKISPLLALVLLPLLAPQKSYAQVRDYNSFAHTIYNKENGISGGKANDIASTNDGILWIGTYEGLYRHNGHEFRLMNDFTSIKAVRTLYVDDEGRLFVGTNDNGLSIIINESVMNVMEEKDGLPADSVRSIIRGSDGLYYVGTAEDMAVLTIADGLGVVATLPAIQAAISLSSDDNGHIAAVTANGDLFLLQGQNIIWNASQSEEKFTSTLFTPDGTLYASTESNRVLAFAVENDTVDLKYMISCGSIRHINSLHYYDDIVFLCADNGAGYIQKGLFSLIETASFNNSIDNMT
ncbi:MAG: hypothetical protein II684_04695, partial [Treponema sp.]|nr:hypothetical protein [Treponema sp.]